MLRAWWRPLYTVSFLVVFTTAAITFAGLSGFAWDETTVIYATCAVLWWLKPLYGRYLLAFPAQAVFGTMPTVRKMLSATPVLLRNGLVWQLTLGRFEFARSFHLPVRQLEGLHARKRRRARFRVLDGGTRGHAVWLSVLCIHLEWIASLGLFGLASLLVPTPALSTTAETMPMWPDDWAWMTVVVYAGVISLIEPIYILCGFGLYLNRRTVLEGWDIELAFRQMAARVNDRDARSLPNRAPNRAPGGSVDAPVPARPVRPAGSIRSGPLGIAIVAMIASVGLLSAPNTRAALEPVAAEVGEASQADAVTKQVLSEPPFLVRDERRGWALREGLEWPDWDWWSWDASTDDLTETDMSLWFKVARGLAVVFKAALWIVAAAGGAWLIWKIMGNVQWRPGMRFGRQRPPTKAVSLASQAAPVALPMDISGSANALVNAGDVRAALALLYQASVERLEAMGVACTFANTENEVVRAVRRNASGEMSRFVEQLVRCWLSAAYADQRIEASEVQRLCQHWGELFERGASSVGLVGRGDDGDVGGQTQRPSR
jgi:hypothetical protein